MAVCQYATCCNAFESAYAVKWTSQRFYAHLYINRVLKCNRNKMKLTVGLNGLTHLLKLWIFTKVGGDRLALQILKLIPENRFCTRSVSPHKKIYNWRRSTRSILILICSGLIDWHHSTTPCSEHALWNSRPAKMKFYIFDGIVC